jgi:hypothetical protein
VPATSRQIPTPGFAKLKASLIANLVDVVDAAEERLAKIIDAEARRIASVWCAAEGA